MRRALLFVSFFLAAAASAAALDIPSERRVILQTGKWTPSKAQTDAALACAQQFLAQPSVKNEFQLSQIKLIRKHAHEYRVQFVGEYRKGKKILLCNFFPIRFADEKDDGFSYWRQQLVEVMDGGFWFWRIEYDPRAGRCGDFSANGEA